MNNDYINLKNFWDNAFSLKEEDKCELLKELKNVDYKSLAPSNKLYEVLSNFKNMDNVLDYGCGTGWASIIMAKYNVKNITAFDVANNAAKMTKFYSEAFNVSNCINPVSGDENWLGNLPSDSFDGFYSSNVIDVIPLDMAKSIIKNSARVLKKDGLAIFSLNYYIDVKNNNNKGFEVKDSSIYINGILRLTSLSDDDWQDLFKPYYELAFISYFSWEGEEKEARRIFVLKKR